MTSLDPATTRQPGDGGRGAASDVAPVGSIGTSATTTLAERLGLGAYTLEVVDVMDLAPSIRRLRVGAADGEALAEFSFEAGQDLMLDITRQGERTIRRRYTVRRFDAAEHVIDIDVVLHGEGPAAQWAAGATPGTQLEAIGPRGKVIVEKDVTWHLFVGDESFAPAASAMLEALDPTQRGIALLEVDSAAEARAIGAEVESRNGVTIRFVKRAGGPVGQAPALLEALREIEIPATSRHAYVAGEHHVVRAIREALMTRGVSAPEISPKAYWRLGQANAEHGEPGSDT